MAGIYGQLIAAQLENLASDPAGTPTGRVYFETTNKLLKWYDSTAWRSAAVTPGAGAVYSNGITLQTVGSFTGAANKIVGVNSGETATEYKTLAVGTSGTDFAIAHAAGSVTFNLPDASATARGVVTTGTQTFAGAKTFTGILAQATNAAHAFAVTIENTGGANNDDNGLQVKVNTTGATKAFNVNVSGTDKFTIDGTGKITTVLTQAVSSTHAFAATIENTSGVNSDDNGLQVKVNTTGATKAFNVNTAGTDKFTVNGNGQLTFASGAGIIGFIDGSTAASTIVGESLIQSRVRSAGLSVATATATNVLASPLALTAGDWEISGYCVLETNATALVTAGTIQYGISKTSASFSASDTIGVPTSGEVQLRDGRSLAVSGVTAFPIAPFSLSVNASQNMYLVAMFSFTGAAAAVTAYGSIHARRLR